MKVIRRVIVVGNEVERGVWEGQISDFEPASSGFVVETQFEICTHRNVSLIHDGLNGEDLAFCTDCKAFKKDEPNAKWEVGA